MDDISRVVRNYYAVIGQRDEDIFELYKDNKRLQKQLDGVLTAEEERETDRRMLKLLVETLQTELPRLAGTPQWRTRWSRGTCATAPSAAPYPHRVAAEFWRRCGRESRPFFFVEGSAVERCGAHAGQAPGIKQEVAR